MDVNRISGYIPGKIVFFLMQARGSRITLPCLHAVAQMLASSQSTHHISSVTPFKPRVTLLVSLLRNCQSESHVRFQDAFRPRSLLAMQVCKAGLSRMRKIWLTRHGQSMSNVFELLGGDSHLSPLGQVYAQKLPDMLIDRVPLVSARKPPWSSGHLRPEIECCWAGYPRPGLMECEMCCVAGRKAQRHQRLQFCLIWQPCDRPCCYVIMSKGQPCC
jgi:hypothetical protein